MFVVNHDRLLKHPLYKCFSTSDSYDNKFHVDELIGGGDEDLPCSGDFLSLL